MLREVLKKTKRPIVVSDFDGTISTRDISYEMLLKFSDGGWRDIDEKYIKGEIGSKEAFTEILKRVNATKSELIDYIDELASSRAIIDPHFLDFYSYTKERGIDLVIVSDGFAFYINTLLSRVGLDDIPIYANDIVEDEDGNLVPVFPHHNDECNKCGTCKTSIVTSLKEEHDYIIYIGDGYSDTCASKEVDTLFARGFLKNHAAKERIPYIYFRGFGDILTEFEKEIRGVIFDLDETLVDSLDAIKTSFVHTIEILKIDTDVEMAFKKMMHWPLNVSMEKIFPGVDLDDAVRIFRKKYYSIFKEMTPIKEGMEDILRALKKEGVKLTVATNKHGPYARELLEHLEILHFFDAVIGAGDVPEPKPAPDMIEEATHVMGTKKRNTVLVGDSIVDIETGKRAEIDVYTLAQSINPPEELAKKRPRKLFYNTLELMRELLSVVPEK